jgi:sulfatase modifying factor 1
MLETKFKVALLVAVLLLTSLPVMGILKGTKLTPFEESPPPVSDSDSLSALEDRPPVPDEMVYVASGPFIRGTNAGGFDEQPQRTVYLDAFAIDKYEVTNFHYQAFVTATRHRLAGPPSRYAKNMARMRGANQPIVYVSWDDANAFCRWKGKRLPTEAEWEKAMRGTDGRLWPWGNAPDPKGANWARVDDGFTVSAPVGLFPRDLSPFGIADGAGNVMEWVADWYSEDGYREATGKNPLGPDHGIYKVLRGAGYASTGADLRITSRSRMVPDFRDETIGFRCATSSEHGGMERSDKAKKITENQSNRG